MQSVSAERALFGPLRTLNVRASMLTGEESAARVETWLRSKQVELNGEVLVITGRGTGSLGGVPVIKNATMRVLSRLRRTGVIHSYGEDTAGSFVVQLAPLRSLLEAPARRSTPAAAMSRRQSSIRGLKPATRDRLRYLAGRAIESLGIKHVSESQLSGEMERQFTLIARTAPSAADPDKWVDSAISRAMEEYVDQDR